MRGSVKSYLGLHALLGLFSLGAVFSKMASSAPFFSFRFCLFYGLMIFNLAFYAICWQQVIKHIRLTTAYANRAVTVIWGLVWGALFFHETITPMKIVSSLIIIAGVVLFVLADSQGEKNG